MSFTVVVLLLKWLSQALLVVVGIWSLLSNPYETDPQTGRKRLTRNGWMKVALLAVGFVLFTFTELDQRRSARMASQRQAEQVKIQRETIQKQEQSLAYLRQVLLQQHQISELEMTLSFPEQTLRRFGELILESEKQKKRTAAKSDPTKLADIGTACSAGNVIVRYGAEGRGQLDYDIYRPMGLVVARVTEADPEWEPFVSAFRSLFGDRLEVISDAGRVLVDLFNPERSLRIQFRRGAIMVAIRSPGIHLDELEGAVSFVCGDTKLVFVQEGSSDSEGRTTQPMGFGPSKIRLTSKDPRVAWDQEIQMSWMPQTTRKIYDVDLDQTAEYGEWRSGPHRVSARFHGIGTLAFQTPKAGRNISFGSVELSRRPTNPARDQRE